MFFFFLLSPLFAQQLATIDSLKTILPKSTPEERIRLMMDIGWQYRLSYPDSTHFYCLEAIALSKANQLYHLATQAYNYRGVASVYQGRYADAYAFHQEALRYATNFSDSSQIAHAYNSLGRLFFSQGDQIKSYDYYHEALKIFEKINDQQGVSYCYKSLAQIYTLQEEFEKVEDLLLKALEIRERINDRRGVISIYQNLAELSQQQHAYDSAMYYLLLAHRLSERSKDEISTAEIDLRMAQIQLERKDYHRSLVTALAALTISQELQNLNLYHSIKLLLGRIYLERNNFSLAEQHLLEVVQYAEKNADLDKLSDAHYFLTTLYSKRGDFENAFSHQMMFQLYKDSLYNAEKAKLIERMEARLLIEHKEYEFKMLRASSLLQEESLLFEKNKNYAQSIIILLVLLLATVMGVSYGKSKKQTLLMEAQKRQIEEQNAEITFQNQALEKLNQEKDSLMSMVAHDLKSPLNRLSGLSELLLMPNQDRQDQEKYVSLIRETSLEGVNLVKELLDNKLGKTASEAGMSEVSLYALLHEQLLRHQAEAQAKEMNIHVQCEEDVYMQTDMSFLNRILDNLISNAIKYSYRDTTIYLSAAKKDQNQVLITVKDEGPGFTEEDKKFLYQPYKRLSARPTRGESSHGLGLSIVKALVEKLNGHIALESTVGQGSTFTLVFPLRKEGDIEPGA
ncbi:MAG: ATP-binding protein [Cyclobacteriaceae bacterium]